MSASLPARANTVAAHTPGPWIVAACRDTDGAAYIESPQTEDRNERVACVFAFEAVEANARLIAAAPRMLAALELALDMLEWAACAADDREAGEVSARARAARRAASDALAQARA